MTKQEILWNQDRIYNSLLNFEDQQTHRSELLDASNFLLKMSMLETKFWLKKLFTF